MTIEKTNQRNKYSDFTAEARDALVIELMATNRSVNEEFDERSTHYRSMGIKTAKDLYSCINPRATKSYNLLISYFNQMVPTRTKVQTILDNQEVTDEQQAKFEKIISIVDRQEEQLREEGFVLDDSVTYHKVMQGRRGSLNLSADFGDILAETSADLLEFELGLAD